MNHVDCVKTIARCPSGYQVANLVFLLALCGLSVRAYALPSFPPVVSSTYTLKSGGAVSAHVTDCTLCHVAAGPPDLNLYGTDVKSALKAAGTKTLTSAILHSIDDKDSDGDGFSNAAEFAADTLPGDAASHPAGAPPVKAPTGTASTDGGTKGTAGANPEPTGWFATLRTLLLPKHGQHPVVVHVPIGLFIGSLLFDLLAFVKKNRGLAYAGFVNLVFAAVSALGAIATGLLAWQWAYGGAALQGKLLIHLVLGCVTTVVFFALLAIRIRDRDRSAPVNVAYLVLAIVGAVLLAVTGHLGGDLSGVNG